jgi:hypothetical protein
MKRKIKKAEIKEALSAALVILMGAAAAFLWLCIAAMNEPDSAGNRINKGVYYVEPESNGR